MNLHQHHKNEFSMMPKRQLFNTVVNPIGVVNQAGYNRTFSAPLAGSNTGLVPVAGVTGKGVLACGNSTANKYLIVKAATASPFFTADLYDSSLNTLTALTISGALAETLADAATDLAQCSLVWLPTRAAWYLKSGSVSKVYPLTLSGTTLTVNTAIDISGTFATTGNLLMTGDTTNTLYFVDNVAGLMKKCSVTALSTIGAFSALTAPTAGYSATTLIAAEMCFVHSNGFIYFSAPSVTGGPVNSFQVYSVAGNSWAAKTWPVWLRRYKAKQCALIADPASNTNLFILGAPQTSTDTTLLDAIVTKYITASDTSELYAVPCAFLQGYSALVSNIPSSFGSAAFCFNQFNLKATFMSVANGDLGWVSVAGSTQIDFSVYNIGTNWGRQTLCNYTGSGFFLGASAPVIAQMPIANAATPPQFVNAPLSLIVTIDGGAERIIQLGGLKPEQVFNTMKLAFSTSLKVEVVGGTFGGVQNADPKNPLFATLLVNIIS